MNNDQSIDIGIIKQLQTQLDQVVTERDSLLQNIKIIKIQLEESQAERINQLERNKQEKEESQAERINELERNKYEKEETFEQLCNVLGVNKKKLRSTGKNYIEYLQEVLLVSGERVALSLQQKQSEQKFIEVQQRMEYLQQCLDKYKAIIEDQQKQVEALSRDNLQYKELIQKQNHKYKEYQLHVKQIQQEQQEQQISKKDNDHDDNMRILMENIEIIEEQNQQIKQYQQQLDISKGNKQEIEELKEKNKRLEEAQEEHQRLTSILQEEQDKLEQLLHENNKLLQFNNIDQDLLLKMQSMYTECEIYKYNIRDAFLYPFISSPQTPPLNNVISLLFTSHSPTNPHPQTNTQQNYPSFNQQQHLQQQSYKSKQSQKSQQSQQSQKLQSQQTQKQQYRESKEPLDYSMSQKQESNNTLMDQFSQMESENKQELKLLPLVMQESDITFKQKKFKMNNNENDSLMSQDLVVSQELPEEQKEDDDTIMNDFQSRFKIDTPQKPQISLLSNNDPHPLFKEHQIQMSQQLEYSQYFNNQSQANIFEK